LFLGNFLIEGFILNKALAPFFPSTDGDGKKQKKKNSNFPPTDRDGKKQKKKKCNFLSLLAGGREGKPKKKKNTHTHTHTQFPPTD
jgi:hypothetical protein